MKAERSYAVGAVVRMTGLSDHVLRAWERRYRAVVPARTAGGTRRYSEADVRRLRLLRQGVEAGNPIRELASLSDEEIERRIAAGRPAPSPPLEEILDAVARLDAAELERLLALQYAALGPLVFARQVALPMLEEIGRRWESGALPIAAEHLATAVARSTLGAALRASRAAARGPTVIFATPAGEHHEMGTLVAALVASACGADAIYLGPDLPAEELSRAAEQLEAQAVVIGRVGGVRRERVAFARRLRAALPAGVELWLGGPSAADAERVEGAAAVPDLDALEDRVRALSAG